MSFGDGQVGDWTQTSNTSPQYYSYANLVAAMEKMKTAVKLPPSHAEVVVCTKVGIEILCKEGGIERVKGDLAWHNLTWANKLLGIPVELFDTELGAEFRASVLKDDGKRVILIKDDGRIV